MIVLGWYTTKRFIYMIHSLSLKASSRELKIIYIYIYKIHYIRTRMYMYVCMCVCVWSKITNGISFLSDNNFGVKMNPIHRTNVTNTLVKMYSTYCNNCQIKLCIMKYMAFIQQINEKRKNSNWEFVMPTEWVFSKLFIYMYILPNLYLIANIL